VFYLTILLYDCTADIEGTCRPIVISAAQTGSVVGFVLLSNCCQALQPPLKRPKTAAKGKLGLLFVILQFAFGFPLSFANVCSALSLQQILGCVQFHPLGCCHKPHGCDFSLFFCVCCLCCCLLFSSLRFPRVWLWCRTSTVPIDSYNSFKGQVF